MILRSALDAEMKDATRAGVALQNNKAEKLPVTRKEENKFWEMGLLGCQSAKSLLNTVYFYNRKLLRLRGGEHRNITVANFELGSNSICFEENVAKTFHGGLTDLKYEPWVVKGCLENKDPLRPLRPQNLKTKTPIFLGGRSVPVGSEIVTSW